MNASLANRQLTRIMGRRPFLRDLMGTSTMAEVCALPNVTAS